MSLLPRSFSEKGPAPSGVCGYVISSEPFDYCGAPATHHIFWESDLSNGIHCAAHVELIKSRWAFYAIHDYVQDYCSHPNAWYDEKMNCCTIPIDDYVHALVDQANAGHG